MRFDKFVCALNFAGAAQLISGMMYNPMLANEMLSYVLVTINILIGIAYLCADEPYWTVKNND